MTDYEEYHESREELRETHAAPRICPVTERENCKWHLDVMHREEWGIEFDFVCKIQSAKYEDNQCPLDFNECKGCGKLVPEEDTVWIDVVTLEAATPPNKNATAYHVGCAPAQRRA